MNAHHETRREGHYNALDKVSPRSQSPAPNKRLVCHYLKAGKCHRD